VRGVMGEHAMKLRLPYLVVVRARSGRPTYYVRKRGKRAVLIRSRPGTPEFFAAYQQALNLVQGLNGSKTSRPLPKTWRWLCAAYMASPEFDALSDATRAQRRNVLEATWAEPIAPGSEILFGECPVAHFGAKQIRVLRDRKRDRPEAANHRLKCIRAVLRWALEAEHVDANPALVVPNIPVKSDGHHTWTLEEVAQYRRRHKLGTKPRLALEILLFTGARRGDVIRFGRPMVADGWLRWNAGKTGEAIAIPILPGLQAALDATPLTGIETWLVTQYGKPFTVAGFGNWFRDRCNEAVLSHCSAHGLRKAAATIAAENGATPHELMAIFGWRSLKQAVVYTRKVDRARLASAAERLIVSKEG
jgi:integrase